jgi:hypothetical protein
VSIRCFTRDERDGIHVIFPIEGPKRQNCMLVNDSVNFVFEAMLAGASLEDIRTAFVDRVHASYERDLAAWDGQDEDARPREPVLRKLHFDLYRIMMQLRDHGICEMSHEDLTTLLPPGNELRGTTQILPVRTVPKLAAFLQEAASVGEKGRFFFCGSAVDKLPPAYFCEEAIIRRHLAQTEVYFVHIDDDGEIEACMVVAGFAYQPASLICPMVSARHASRKEFLEAIGKHFSRVCGLLSVVTLSAMIRFQILTGDGVEMTLDPELVPFLGELGFRKAYDLANEFGPGRGIIAYDKTLL